MNDVKQFFVDAFRHVAGNRPVPNIEVGFYPYAGLHHTIRLRSGRVYVRLSDICKDSPHPVLGRSLLSWLPGSLGNEFPMSTIASIKITR